MKSADQHLARRLAIAIVVKVLCLSGLWWYFVKDQQVTVDTQAVSQQMLPLPPTSEPRP